MKKLQLFLVLSFLAIGAWAQQITEQQAMDRALQYLNTNTAAKARGLDGKQLNLKAAKVEPQSFYAFNLEGGGYVIASGDSRALPVLGYSDKGTIDWDHMPENMRAWLKSYDEAMATLGDRQDFKDGIALRKQAKTRAPKAAIEPLIKTFWNQGAPYWNKIPLYDGANPDWKGQPCPTGCVATAMAMIMNYNQWPKAACEPIPEYEYETAHENKKKTVHFDALPATTFDWDNMIAQYEGPDGKVLGTEAQQDAVATLMSYCGQSVYMEYSPLFSGSDHQQVVEALIKYFGYKNTVRCINRIKYSIDGWEDLVYSELAAGRPIQYGAFTDIDGHSFICDGYDGNGLFHINWGWGGDDDGFFALSVLNPYDNANIGASSSELGYCIQQDIVAGVEPDVDGTSSKLPMPQTYLIDDNPIGIYAADSVFFNYQFISFTYDNEEVFVNAALGTVDDNGVLTPIFTVEPSDTLVYLGENWHNICVDSTAFEPGETLHLCPMVKFYNIPGADWQLLGAPDEHYIVAGRTPEGDFFLYRDLVDLEIIKTEFTRGSGRIGMFNELTLTIRNHSPFESSRVLMLAPYYYGHVKPEDITAETPYSEGDPFLTGGYLRAGQDSEAIFSFKPLASGTIYLLLAYPDGRLLADTFIEVSDTIGSYESYLVNNSYVTHDGNHYVYHVELCDRTDVTVPQGVPSDSIYFHARISSADDTVTSGIRIEDELRDYLRALPDSAGSGNYKFTAEVSLDIEQDGDYYVISYLVEWLNAEQTAGIQSNFYYESFPVTVDPTAIKGVGDASPALDDAIYDLQGRRYDVRPTRKGIYIRNNRKEIVR